MLNINWINSTPVEGWNCICPKRGKWQRKRGERAGLAVILISWGGFVSAQTQSPAAQASLIQSSVQVIKPKRGNKMETDRKERIGKREGQTGRVWTLSFTHYSLGEWGDLAEWLLMGTERYFAPLQVQSHKGSSVWTATSSNCCLSIRPSIPAVDRSLSSDAAQLPESSSPIHVDFRLCYSSRTHKYIREKQNKASITGNNGDGQKCIYGSENPQFDKWYTQNNSLLLKGYNQSLSFFWL